MLWYKRLAFLGIFILGGFFIVTPDTQATLFGSAFLPQSATGGPSLTSYVDDSAVVALPFVLSGKANAGAQVSVSIAGSVYLVQADEDGLFALTVLDQLLPGQYNISLVAADKNGEVSFSTIYQIVYAPKQVVEPSTGTLQEVSEATDDVLRRDSFLLVLQKNSSSFHSDQLGHIQVVAGDSLDFLVRPERPAHSITARLYANIEAGSKQNLGHDNSVALVDLQQSGELPQGWSDGFVFFPDKDFTENTFRGEVSLSDDIYGNFELAVSVNYMDGSRSHLLKQIEVRRPGVVWSQNKIRVVNFSRVELFQADTDGAGEFVSWDAGLYGQTNPLETSNGSFAFYVPPGDYYFSVLASGFEPFQSGVYLAREPQIISTDVVLQPKRLTNTWDRWWGWLARRLGTS